MHLHRPAAAPRTHARHPHHAPPADRHPAAAPAPAAPRPVGLHVHRRPRWRAAAGVLAAVMLLGLAACGGGDGGDGAAATGDPAGDTTYPAAPELEGLGQWWNAEPFTLATEREAGRVVLIDFWTYTCVNCIRTLPYLRAWDEAYRDHGLTILGLHAPEFDFEHDPANVEEAIRRHQIAYPVAQDNDFRTWRAYENRFWPAKYLVGVDGTLRYAHFGEGDYRETEEAIRVELERAGHDLSGVPLASLDDPTRDAAATQQTRELYAGYQRNFSSQGRYAGQDEYYIGADRLGMYEDTGPHAADQWYAHGWWRNEAEAFVHARQTDDLSDYIAVPFAARTVHVVLRGAPDPDTPLTVVAELDGRPLTPQEAGRDIEYDDAGRSVLRVQDARLYRVVALPGFAERELRLRTDSPDFAFFSFTFGSYDEGD